MSANPARFTFAAARVAEMGATLQPVRIDADAWSFAVISNSNDNAIELATISDVETWLAGDSTRIARLQREFRSLGLSAHQLGDGAVVSSPGVRAQAMDVRAANAFLRELRGGARR